MSFLEILWREKTTWLSALHSDGLLNYIKQLWLTEKTKVSFEFLILFCAIGAHI